MKKLKTITRKRARNSNVNTPTLKVQRETSNANGQQGENKLEELQREVQKQQLERVTKCKEAIELSLAKYHCRLVASVVVTETGNSPLIDVVAIEPS